MAILVGASPVCEGKADEPLPPFQDVVDVVERYLAERQIAQGEVLARSEVAPLFQLLKVMGWNVQRPQAILNRVLPDGSFLVREFRTDAGRKFARQISVYPLAFDRLDRLSSLPHGKQTIRDLIKGPDGYKLIEYMTETPGGSELGRMLSQAPGGEHFNEPTGRIYTADDLLRVLEASYAAALRKQQGEIERPSGL